MNTWWHSCNAHKWNSVWFEHHTSKSIEFCRTEVDICGQLQATAPELSYAGPCVLWYYILHISTDVRRLKHCLSPNVSNWMGGKCICVGIFYLFFFSRKNQFNPIWLECIESMNFIYLISNQHTDDGQALKNCGFEYLANCFRFVWHKSVESRLSRHYWKKPIVRIAAFSTETNFR